jgi:N-acetylmuramoyl-L-alanine amidase
LLFATTIFILFYEADETSACDVPIEHPRRNRFAPSKIEFDSSTGLEWTVRLFLALILALPAPNPTTVTLLVGGKTFNVSAAEAGALLSIPDVVTGLGGNSRPQAGASLAIEVAGHRIVAADGVATAAFDNRVVNLSHPTRSFSGTLYAPWEFFEKTIFPAAGLSAEYERSSAKIRTHAGGSAAVALEVSLVHLDQMTQVVFRGSGPVASDTSSDRDQLTVAFKSPVVAPFLDKSFDDPLVSRIHFSENSAVLSLRAPDLAVNAYTLKAPDRLVLEIVRPASPGAAAPAPAAPSAPPALRTVVIDPGHGGEETGAVGPANIVEKDVTLDIARRLAGVLSRDAAVRTVLTRNTDTLTALDERAAVANHEKAALFISIHANSSRAAGAHGSETYYLSLAASDKLSEAVAREENAPAGPAPPSPDSGPALDFILWDMAQSAHLKESAVLAEAIQNELNALLNTGNRGIKQAPFRVLVGATMPAVLVETAFISNPEEARQLTNPEFRQSVAEAIGRAVAAYLRQHPPGASENP